MTRRGGDEFLEEVIAAGATQQLRPPAYASPAFQVTQAWAKLRTRQQPHHLQEALAVLRNNRHSLYIGEPQVRLLLSLVSSSRHILEENRTNHENDSSGNSSADVEAIGSMRASVALIISIWVRRSFLNDGTNKLNNSSKSATTLQAVADAYCDLLQVPVASDFYICEAILLLGAVCAAHECYANTRELCQTALVEELTIRRNIIVKSVALPEALAGVGYAMTASRDSMLTSITGALRLLWTPTLGDYEVNLMKHNSCKPPLDAAVMVLRLFEFLGRWLMSSNGTFEGADAIYKELLRGTNVGAPPEVKNVTVMAAAGVLRGTFHRRKMDFSDSKWLPIKEGLESLVTAAAAQSSQGICNSPAGAEEQILSQYIAGNELQPVSDGTLHQMRCVSLAVASCRDFPAHPSVLFCLVFALLGDVLNLAPIYSAQVSIVLKALKISESRQASIELRQELQRALEQLKMRVERVIFREVGAIARAMCEQYRRVATAHQQQIEMIFWKYSLELYQKHRTFAALCSEEFIKEDTFGSMQFLGELQNEDLNKILEAVFLSTVLLFSSSIGGTISENDSATAEIHLRKHELAPVILDSLSCVEYFRHLQIPEYSETVRQCAALVSESRTASVKFANLLPSYQDVISWPGESTFSAKYSWCLDEVQSSRVHFYLRVLPLCLEQLDDVLFANHIAPIAFLYMCHPSKQLAEASHAVFVSLISRTRDSEELNSHEETSLVEQLAVYYVIRALEGYPDLTPFEGLVSGVTAIVRYLPAGSAAIIHCIDRLVDKAVALFSVTSQDTKQEGLSADDDEAAHKIQTLLSHLILLVDIQVLQHLLKQLAKLILSLPSAAQERALREALAIIAGSDDYVRKPIVVPWLQSLAFLSSTGNKMKEQQQHYTGFFGRNSRL